MPAAAARRYLLDTNILLHLIRGNQTGKEIATFFDLWNPDAEVQISVVTVGEILSFARRRGWGTAKIQEMERLLSSMARIDIHRDDVLSSYADIDCHSLGCTPSREMGKNDLWIAACASVNGVTLLTTDGDFDHLDSAFVTLVHIDPRTGRPRATS